MSWGTFLFISLLICFLSQVPPPPTSQGTLPPGTGQERAEIALARCERHLHCHLRSSQQDSRGSPATADQPQGRFRHYEGTGGCLCHTMPYSLKCPHQLGERTPTGHVFREDLQKDTCPGCVKKQHGTLCLQACNVDSKLCTPEAVVLGNCFLSHVRCPGCPLAPGV